MTKQQQMLVLRFQVFLIYNWKNPLVCHSLLLVLLFSPSVILTPLTPTDCIINVYIKLSLIKLLRGFCLLISSWLMQLTKWPPVWFKKYSVAERHLPVKYFPLPAVNVWHFISVDPFNFIDFYDYLGAGFVLCAGR